MQPGAYIDAAQITLYVFWIFFALLIWYLRREDKREGYPLVTETGGKALGFPVPPGKKSYRLMSGETSTLPNTGNDRPDVALTPTAVWPGAPSVPTGNPFTDGVGPGSYAQRKDVAELRVDGSPAIVPLRVAKDITIDPHDPDPRGMDVIGGDGVKGGVVTDVWVDRAEDLIRYIEVEVAGGRKVLLPIGFAVVHGSRNCIEVDAIFGEHFAHVPGTRSADQVTKLEEDRICGYYGAGTLYASPARQEPLL